jgi:hypothetical protein
MAMFHRNTMPTRPQANGSFLSRLMTDVGAKSASLFRFLYAEEDDDDVLELLDDDGNNDQHTSNNILFDYLLEKEDVAGLVNDLLPTVANVPRRAQKAKKKRTKYARKNQRESLWWKRFLVPVQRQEMLMDPNGRLAKYFRKMFHIPYELFLDLMNVAIERWFTEWNQDNICNAGKLVSSLDLKILGAMFVLTQGVSHFVTIMCSNLSEEIHRSFFLQWISNMSSIREEFIFMPHDDDTFNKVTNEYAARGLPGCVGSVDCVHIGWDRCPAQYRKMYKGKEGYPSVAYEVKSTSRKFIQSVSCGHPGARNDKHIFKTDLAMMGLMQTNGWLNPKALHCSSGAPNGKKTFFGVYLICDGGYQAIPCLMYPSKNGLPNSPEMLWSKNVESVRKDIEGVFGILKVRFRFLKNFNNLRRQSSIDDAFITCCILHNMMLEKDGFLNEDLPPYPGGLEESLSKKFGKNRWNGLHGMWRRGCDDTPDLPQNANDPPPLVALPNPRFDTEVARKAMAERHRRIKIALVEHFNYGTISESQLCVDYSM